MARKRGKDREREILTEIVDKFQDFENEALPAIASAVDEGSELYLLKPPPRKPDTFTNPRLTEFHRAANALATTVFRMHTSHDPNWSMELLSYPSDFDSVETVRKTIETQLEASDWRKNHLRALRFCATDGSVIVQEDFGVVGRGAQGLQVPVTHYRPMRIDQVAYDLGATNIDEADWVAAASLMSVGQIKALAGHNKKHLGSAWIKKGLDNAVSIEEDRNRMNQYLRARMVRGGAKEEELNKKRELIMYYGKIDAIGDGVEYVVGIINRKTIVRFHENNFQHGRRQFRWGSWIDFDRLRGYGLTELFARSHKDLDSSVQRISDAQAMNEFGMLGFKPGEFDPNDAEIAPFNLLPMEDKDSMFRIPGAGGNMSDSMGLVNLMVSNLRSASLANDTLQGLANDATATANALAQNESFRALSAIGEPLGDDLFRKHLQVMHGNNATLLKDSFPINVGGAPRTAYPRDFRLFADFRVKITTDKDFRPGERKELLELLQTLSSTKNTDQRLTKLASIPILQRLLHSYGINPQEVNAVDDAPLAGSDLDAAGFNGLDAGAIPAEGGFNAAEGVAGTPVGPVQVSQ